MGGPVQEVRVRVGTRGSSRRRAQAGAWAMNMGFVCEVFVWGDGVRIGVGVDQSREGKGEGALIFWPRGGRRCWAGSGSGSGVDA